MICFYKPEVNNMSSVLRHFYWTVISCWIWDCDSRDVTLRKTQVSHVNVWRRC